ncbi:MAG: glycosyltransferase family 39 protein [Acidobacteria bacterium]|nr:glycosyltransferase family 39 protein [Acidobacteriota bacterium]
MAIPAASQREKVPSCAPGSLPGSWAVPLAMAAGFLLRLNLARTTFLNPDEALHFFLAHNSSLAVAYEASLTTAHPPLMILFLHLWSLAASSELFLRLPFLVAGVVSSWVMFLWVEMVANRRAALFALAIFLFSPPLVSLQAEIRQYSFLLLFSASSLYFLERAVKRNSLPWMALSAAFLDLALLTHYSALIFLAAAGAYALVVLRKKPKTRAAIAWIGGQTSALAISLLLFETQVLKLRESGLPSEIRATWLRSSIFHPGEDRVLWFAWTRTLRLFRYFFSHGTVGVAGLFLFLFSLVAILRRSKSDSSGPAREIALVLVLPFAITLGAAIAGVYPYGGSRHDVLLALFAVPGVAIGLDQLRTGKVEAPWLKPAVIAAALVLSNLFPSPAGPYIRPRNQRRELMDEAIRALRSLAPGSVVVTDAQGAPVLDFYLCPEPMASPLGRGAAGFVKLPCGGDYVLVAPRSEAGLDRERFPELLAEAWRAAPDAGSLLLFESGWIDDKEAEWLEELRALGGIPRNFGPNILLCRIRRPAGGQP